MKVVSLLLFTNCIGIGSLSDSSVVLIEGNELGHDPTMRANEGSGPTSPSQSISPSGHANDRHQTELQPEEGVLPRITRLQAAEPFVVGIERPSSHSFEIPPVILPRGAWRQFFISTGWSFGCAAPEHPLTPGFSATNKCTLATYPASFDPQTSVRKSASASTSTRPWQLNYSGIYGVQIVAGSEPWVLAVHHAETKNEMFGTPGDGHRDVVQNPFSTVLASDCASQVRVVTETSGHQTSVYDECWEAYMAFVTASWTPYAATTGWGLWGYDTNDLGPLVWPAAGYIDASGKTVGSVRHPSLFYADGFFYLYYLDQSQRPGQWGLKVARSKTGLPGSYWVWDGRSFSVAALPSDFLPGSITQFINKGIGDGRVLFGGRTNRFNVATYLPQNGTFLGVEEYFDTARNEWAVALRTSRDLVTWSEPVDVEKARMPSQWEKGRFHYPVLVDEPFRTSQAVGNDFFLLGTFNGAPTFGEQLSGLRISVTIE
jgi:hypothetical protein